MGLGTRANLPDFGATGIVERSHSLRSMPLAHLFRNLVFQQ